jgi:hypothetical protein
MHISNQICTSLKRLTVENDKCINLGLRVQEACCNHFKREKSPWQECVVKVNKQNFQEET